MAKNGMRIQIEAEEKLFPTPVVQNVFQQSASLYNQHSSIVEEIATRLVDRLQDTNHKFPKILDLGAGTGIVQQEVFKHFTPELFISADFSQPMLQQATGTKVLCNAEEGLPFADESFDLVISNLMLPWVNDIPKCLHIAGKTLKKDGLFLASTLGVESFKEFRHAFEAVGLSGGHTLPFPDVQSAGAVLQRRGFALPVVDRDPITISFPNFKSIYQTIRALGGKNINPNRNKGLTSRQQWQKMENFYKENYTLEDGSLALTLEVIYLHGWRPHPSQQQPLKPGSGKSSLLTALKG